MAHQDPPSRRSTSSLILHYGLAVVSVALAVGSALLLRRFGLRESLFLIAIAVTVWFGGMGPGLLAIVLSDLSIDYFFVPPTDSISLDLSHIPYFIIFTSFAFFISWLSASRRHAEQDLREPATNSKGKWLSRSANCASRPACSISHMTVFSCVTLSDTARRHPGGVAAHRSLGRGTGAH
jgi:K+-sensing histidine kinase KdpD